MDLHLGARDADWSKLQAESLLTGAGLGSPAAHSSSPNDGCSGHTSQQVQDKDAGGRKPSQGGGNST